MISLSPLLCPHHEVVESLGVLMIPRAMPMVAQIQSPMLDRSRDRGQMTRVANLLLWRQSDDSQRLGSNPEQMPVSIRHTESEAILYLCSTDRISYNDCSGDIGAQQPSQSRSYCSHLYSHTWGRETTALRHLATTFPLILDEKPKPDLYPHCTVLHLLYFLSAAGLLTPLCHCTILSTICQV